ncbi:5-methylcytosine-specific restriction enzyme A [Arthrobacter sp. ok909]|uniref:HNH endonuclease n=1 Tax=Arthrobacter sp. ok909 TaxID=1761746 RepID=UPI00087F005B|nr:HNH endonuclease [Arthrobacter sp. ok909]SDP21726.1 5-methylcytosine-specific restriction enzyme A [Arthrobacter sp. ok909]
MSAIILVWNPDEWNNWTYPAVLEEVGDTGWFLASWEVGNGDATSGAEAWLVLQGRHGRGLIGHGVIVSERPATHFPAPDFQTHSGEAPDSQTSAAQTSGAGDAAPAASRRYVRVAFDSLLAAGDQIPFETLTDAVPGIDWEALHDSGLAIDPSAEPLLRGLWSEFGPQAAADPTQIVPGTVPAAIVSRVEVNRYEHSADAQRVCIADHGTSCAVCGFSFEIAYGELGKDFTPVHHLVPASQLGNNYELDPVTDLVPLCANCHAMAHHGVRTPRTVAELRRIVADAGYLAGQTLTATELQAQQDARRILDQH